MKEKAEIRKVSGITAVRCCAIWVFTFAFASNALAQQKPVVFTDVTSAAKITWTHDNLATPEKYLIETMGGGGAFLDYNQDGLMDIFFVNSGATPYNKPKAPSEMRFIEIMAMARLRM